MLKVIQNIPVLPESLNVTGIRIPTPHDYIGHGGFGHIVKGELRGDAVALKVLYNVDNKVVSCSYQCHNAIGSFQSKTGFLSGSIDVAIPLSQVRATVFRNIPKRININGTNFSRLAIYEERDSGTMAKESKSIDCGGRRTCMVSVLPLFVDTHSARKILEVAKGIKYIHSEGVVHGDLHGVLYLKHIM